VFPLTLGTAGHIDHGKTLLVEALTGTNTDRLPQERARGISIELGFASFELPSGRRLSIVDVPGHERFVRTMVAGATGIDLFLLVVAADDGVMPQTREHLRIIEMLAVPAGVVAVTKTDLVGAGDLEDCVDGVRALLADGPYERSPIVPVSAKEGAHLNDLVSALDAVASQRDGRAGGGGELRLHVDRSFSLKGIGTVVTGTLWSGALQVGDDVRIEPTKRTARVRSIEVHGVSCDRADAGQRVAANLAGTGRQDVDRGYVLVARDSNFRATYLVDAAVELIPGARRLARGARVQVHHGTRSPAARLAPIETDTLEPKERQYVQLRLEQPIFPAAGDRFILRQVSPPGTIGGGVVVDASPRKHGPGSEHVERLELLERGDPLTLLAAEQVVAPNSGLQSAVQAERSDPRAGRLIEMLRQDALEPRGLDVLASLVGMTAIDARRLLEQCLRDGTVERLGPTLYYHPDALDDAERRVIALCERDGSATIAALRDELGTSRKYAQALLEHFDRRRLTRRQGDEHLLRR
jgi:selenocysteine-specific elongation factor